MMFFDERLNALANGAISEFGDYLQAAVIGCAVGILFASLSAAVGAIRAAKMAKLQELEAATARGAGMSGAGNTGEQQELDNIQMVGQTAV